MCSLLDDPECPMSGRHGELGEGPHTQKIEEAVYKVLVAIKSFTNTIVPGKDWLYSFASGIPAPLEV